MKNRIIKVITILSLLLILFSSSVFADEENTETNKDNSIQKETSSEKEETKEEVEKPKSNETTKKEEKAEKAEKPKQVAAQPKKKNLNKNSHLDKMEVKGYTLVPEFDKDVFKYDLEVGIDVTSIEIEAEPEVDTSVIKILGAEELNEEENLVTVNVKSESGNTQAYKINVKKVNKELLTNANLGSLIVENKDYKPEFKPETTSYYISLKDVETLNIIATPENPNAKVEILGNENLQKGNNKINIKVTSEDGTKVKEYLVDVKIGEEKVELQKESKVPAYVLLGIIGFLILICLIRISNEKRK